jgi:hypothetical protein
VGEIDKLGMATLQGIARKVGQEWREVKECSGRSFAPNGLANLAI